MLEIIIEFFNSNFFIALTTIFVGGFAFNLYRKQKADAKRDAARIIIQEIRRAEDIISRFKEQGNFQFTKRIIANNSWGKNIHYFVGDLDNDELDKISNLYSMGEFLDSLIARISNWRFDRAGEEFLKRQPSITISPTPPFPSTQTPGVQTAAGQQILEIQLPQEPFWNPILKEIVFKYEPIYHSTILEKLKKLAELE